jgi:aspartate aminotransferase-like enzyme
MSKVLFKEAETTEEFEQIHRLNHRVFADEVGQHDKKVDGRLIDRFHSRNRYFIASRRGEIVGMISANAGPEFSIASRLEDKSVLRGLHTPLEIRLLAIEPKYRRMSILAGLLWQVGNYARKNHFSDLLISGIVERVPMYEKIGFKAMGPAVPSGAASFVPMRLSIESAGARLASRERLYGARWRRDHAVSLLPGPVAISNRVTAAFHEAPVSHRSQWFIQQYQETRSRLSALMGELDTVILCGSGTLGNDAVAANLYAALGDPEGLVIANGEFGERLARQASSAGLRFSELRFPWGSPWDFDAIERALGRRPAWVWAVHLETSTGVQNDLTRLTALAGNRGIPVAADCVSSLGAGELNDVGRELFLASGVSGKALGSFAGLAFVFVSKRAHALLEGKRTCPTFDLVGASRSEGPVSTLPSPAVLATLEALRENFSDIEASALRYRHYEELGCWAREELRKAGITLLAAEADAAPTVSTFPLPSAGFALDCLRAGFRIAHESDYLRARKWGQIATMGQLDRSMLEPFFAAVHTEMELV